MHVFIAFNYWWILIYAEASKVFAILVIILFLVHQLVTPHLNYFLPSSLRLFLHFPYSLFFLPNHLSE